MSRFTSSAWQEVSHSKSRLKQPNKHWGPHSHRPTQQGAQGRLSCSNTTQHLLGNIIQMSKIIHRFQEGTVQCLRPEAALEFTVSQIELGQHIR